MITLGDTVGNWSDAMRLLEAQLACPCGASNRPGVREIRIDNFGQAVCVRCSQRGTLQDFAPPFTDRRKDR